MPTILIARTDAGGAELLTSDVDERDHPFLTGERTVEGFFAFAPGSIRRSRARSAMRLTPTCSGLKLPKPDLAEAKKFAESIHAKFPGKLLAYNCSPSFNWKAKLDGATIAKFQRELGAMGYKFQFVTLAGFHALNYSMFKLARGYRDRGMAAYSELQEAEFAAETDGYTATKHQHEVGTGYFDEVAQVIAGGASLDSRTASDQPKPSSFIERNHFCRHNATAGSRLSAPKQHATPSSSTRRHFDEITRRARDRFLKREWRGSFDDARERLLLYSLILSSLTNRVQRTDGRTP